MVRDIDPADPGASPDAEKWDSMTFEDLKKSMLWTKGIYSLSCTRHLYYPYM